MLFTGLIQWILLLVSTIAHPFYVGVADVEFDNEDKRVEVAVKLFTDDLERALREAYDAPVLDISGENEHALTDSLIQNYIGKHFTVTISEKTIPMRYLGREGNVDATWVYIYFPTDEVPISATIGFTALFEIFEDQRNLVHVKTDDYTTSICDAQSPTTNVVFN